MQVKIGSNRGLIASCKNRARSIFCQSASERLPAEVCIETAEQISVV
jgi:hypothetical protein